MRCGPVEGEAARELEEGRDGAHALLVVVLLLLRVRALG
jgi:hypothetical protein